MLKILTLAFVVLVGVIGITILTCDRVVTNAAIGRCFAKVEDIPHRKVGLLLGTSRLATPAADGTPRINLFYKYRLDAAIALFEAGKIDIILISGDNSKKDYDEPTDIFNDLAARGIPKEKMVRDYAGFRTLDSIVRAKEIFQTSELTVISQKFHDERAIYIARSKGMDVVGFVANSPPHRYSLKVMLREYLARVGAIVDKNIGRAPHFLGSPVEIE